MARGQVPYRDFGLEYPPGALPVFVLPALGHHEESQFASFRRSFEWLMWGCGVLMLVAMAFALRALGASERRTVGALLFAALAPLALGSVVLSRFDLWPAAIVGGGAGGDRLGEAAARPRPARARRRGEGLPGRARAARARARLAPDGGGARR